MLPYMQKGPHTYDYVRGLEIRRLSRLALTIITRVLKRATEDVMTKAERVTGLEMVLYCWLDVGGRGHEPRNAGSLYKLEKARNPILC